MSRFGSGFTFEQSSGGGGGGISSAAATAIAQAEAATAVANAAHMAWQGYLGPADTQLPAAFESDLYTVTGDVTLGGEDLTAGDVIRATGTTTAGATFAAAWEYLSDAGALVAQGNFVDFMGTHDLSTGAPTATAIGQEWCVTSDTVFDGVTFTTGDIIRSVVANPSLTEFDGNWTLIHGFGHGATNSAFDNAFDSGFGFPDGTTSWDAGMSDGFGV